MVQRLGGGLKSDDPVVIKTRSAMSWLWFAEWAVRWVILRSKNDGRARGLQHENNNNKTMLIFRSPLKVEDMANMLRGTDKGCHAFTWFRILIRVPMSISRRN